METRSLAGMPGAPNSDAAAQGLLVRQFGSRRSDSAKVGTRREQEHKSRGSALFYEAFVGFLAWYSRPELNRDGRFRKPLLYPFELRERRRERKIEEIAPRGERIFLRPLADTRRKSKLGRSGGRAGSEMQDECKMCLPPGGLWMGRARMRSAACTCDEARWPDVLAKDIGPRVRRIAERTG